MHIAHKLSLSFLSIALLIGLVGYLASWSSEKALERSIGRASVNLAEETISAVDRQIYSRIQEFRTYSRGQLLQDTLARSNREFEALGDVQAHIDRIDEQWTSAPRQGPVMPIMADLIDAPLSREFRSIMRRQTIRYGYTVFPEMFLTNRYGANCAQSGRTTDYRQDDETWWREAQANGVCVGDLQYDESAQTHLIEIAIALKDGEGEFAGVLKIGLNLEEAVSIIREARRGVLAQEYQPEAFTLLNGAGKVIYSTRDFTVFQDTPASLREQIDFQATRTIAGTLTHSDAQGRALLCSYARSNGHREFQGLGWVLLLEHDREVIHAPVAALRASIWLTSLAVALVGLSIGGLISRSISRRIIHLQQGVAQIGRGDFDQKLGTKVKDEIGQLSRDVDRMAENLKAITASRDELNREIAERERVERALRESEERLRSLFGGIDDGIFVHDEEGRILDCNEAACRRLGYTREAILSLHTRDIDAPEFAEGFAARLAEQKERGGLSCEGVHVTKDGRRIPVDINTSVIDYHGQTAVLAVMRDITDRKKAMEALRRSEANLREAERIAHLGNWESDLTANTLWWSDEVYRIFGLTPETFHGTREAFLECVHPDDRDRVRQALEDAFARKTPYSIEHRIVRPDGRVRTVLERGEATFDDNGRPIRMLGTVQDVTERKAVEESLRNSEALYSSLVENIPQFIFRKDLQGQFTFANQKFCAMLNKSLEEIIGTTDFDFYPPELAEKYRHDDQAVLRSDTLFDTVEENRTPDGKRIFVRVLKTPIHNAKGAVVGVQGIFWDITEQKRAEEELRAERDHSARIITGTPAIICGIAPDGTTNFINPAGERTTGYAAAEVVGKNWWKVFYPGEQYRQVEQLFRDFEKGNVVDYEMTLTTKTGGKRIISWNSINRFDERGNLIEVVGFGNDVTDRRKAEQALQRSEERYALAQRAANIGSWDWDIRTNALHWSEQIEPMFGFARGAFAGTYEAFLECIHPADRQYVLDSVKACVEERQDYVIEHRIVRPDGSIRWVAETGDVVRDEHGDALRMLGIVRDITQRKEAQEKLRETMKELERSNRELEQFAYIASHDLQEPLRMVASFTQLLARRYKGQLDQNADEYIDFAVDGAKRMQRLLNDLLAYSRVTTRAKPLEPTDSESVLAQALDNLKLAIEDTEAVVTHDPLPGVMADETQLLQVFQNLLGNAIKFHGDAPPLIHVSAQLREGKWLFSVRDNGIGIDRQDFDRIFQVFQRAHSRSEYPGTGIGLAICQKTIARHGGEIWVESEVGKSTTFYFTLPRKESDSA